MMNLNNAIGRNPLLSGASSVSLRQIYEQILFVSSRNPLLSGASSVRRPFRSRNLSQLLSQSPIERGILC